MSNWDKLQHETGTSLRDKVVQVYDMDVKKLVLSFQVFN